MNTDIRIIISFRDHRKTKRLRGMIGDRAVEYLVNLWLGVAQNAPEGKLTGWEPEDIAHEARFDGDPQEFVAALMHPKICFLEKDFAGNFVVHDWEENNCWAAGAKRREEAARNAAKARWKKKFAGDDATEEHAPALPAQCDGSNQEGKKTRKTALPAQFNVTEKMVKYADDKGFCGDIASETENFVNWVRRKGAKYVDWEAAWQNWIKKSMEYDATKKAVPQAQGEKRTCGSCAWFGTTCHSKVTRKKTDIICDGGIYSDGGK
jgi:hypothetical protein